MRFRYFFAIGFCSLAQWLPAQKMQPSSYFKQLLEETGLEVFEPVDAGYRSFELWENEYLNCQYAINSRREDLEIRYYIMPWDEADANTTAPNVTTFRILTTVATNSDNAVISGIQPPQEFVQKNFNADWGMTYFFTPKPAFSDAPACKLMAISKEGKGTVFIFFLFDDPGNSAIDLREASMRFK